MAKFKPRARIIRTIGDNLISGPEAAVIELVKNAYDADSPSVEIKISPPTLDLGGKIIVKDYGHGMTYENILNDWLEPATDTKSKSRTSKSGIRTVLGAKGVGRFASASLGSRLKLTSVAKVDDVFEISRLHLSWDIFESNKYLDEIDINIEKSFSIETLNTGVEIEIDQLSTIWSSKKLQKLIRELRRLATPQHTPNCFDIYLFLDDFKKELSPPYNFDGNQLLIEKNNKIEKIYKDNNDEFELNRILPYSLNDESDYHLKGCFDDFGEFNGTFSIVRGDNLSQEVKLPAPSLESNELYCGAFDIDLKLFDLEIESIESLFKRMGLDFSAFGLRAARTLLSENTGVAIYRSGFRIRPYGEPDNDWLHLEKRRVQNPSKRIGHGQIAGAIHVQSESESNLIERSSREGLENNGAFERLIRLVTELLIKVEQKRFDFRAKAGISRKPLKDINKAREIASLDSIAKAVQSLSPEEQKPILLKIEKESKALTKTLDEIEAYQKLLESRAALGMVVAQVIHDGRTYLEPINSSARSIVDNISYLLEDSKKGEIVRKYYPTYGETIQTGAKGLSSLFKSLDPISGRKKGRPVSFSILETVTNALNLLDDECIENGIITNIDINPLSKAYGYMGDMQSALMNIFQNAIHWLSTVNKDEKLIFVSESSTENTVQVSIKNNGPIIDNADVDSIFEAGFTLKSDGHGLGLVIAREACRHSKGELILVTNIPETHFMIEFPIISGQI